MNASGRARGGVGAKLTGMTSKLLGVVLIAGGLWLGWTGYQRSESVAGVADGVGASIANAIDGEARQPKHVWYYAGGGAAVLVGLGLVLRKS